MNLERFPFVGTKEGNWEDKAGLVFMKTATGQRIYSTPVTAVNCCFFFFFSVSSKSYRKASSLPDMNRSTPNPGNEWRQIERPGKLAVPTGAPLQEEILRAEWKEKCDRRKQRVRQTTPVSNCGTFACRYCSRSCRSNHDW